VEIDSLAHKGNFVKQFVLRLFYEDEEDLIARMKLRAGNKKWASVAASVVKRTIRLLLHGGFNGQHLELDVNSAHWMLRN